MCNISKTNIGIRSIVAFSESWKCKLSENIKFKSYFFQVLKKKRDFSQSGGKLVNFITTTLKENKFYGGKTVYFSF